MPAITSLQVTYRCLENVKMSFCAPKTREPAPFIALVGANGAGKTTLLEAITAVFRSCGHVAGGFSSAPMSSPTRLHFGTGAVGFDLQTKTTPELRGHFEPGELSRALYVPSGYLPIMKPGVPLTAGPAPGLSQALVTRPSEERIHQVHQWWLHQHWEYPRTASLDRLWRALEPFLGNRVYAGVNPADHMPQFDAGGVKVGFNDLSSGERRIVLLFLEIAMQCGEDGLVLFDEPEAHFHPAWQRMLRDALHQLLPRGQVIVATHSPFIVEGLPAHQLFVLGDLPW